MSETNIKVVERYLEKSIEAKADYSSLKTSMNDNPKEYIDKLTKKDMFG